MSLRAAMFLVLSGVTAILAVFCLFGAGIAALIVLGTLLNGLIPGALGAFAACLSLLFLCALLVKGVPAAWDASIRS